MRTAGFVREIARMNHFERDLATQIRVERFVCHAHGATAKLDWRPVIPSNQLILVELMWSGGVIDIFVA